MDNTPTLGDDPGSGGLDRRAVLRRGAILGGALVWTVPAVQTLAGPAFAAGSALCVAESTTTVGGQCVKVVFQPDATCCGCITTTTASLGLGDAGEPIAVALCYLSGDCTPQSSGSC